MKQKPIYYPLFFHIHSTTEVYKVYDTLYYLDLTF
jgi:hypothetical protein